MKDTSDKIKKKLSLSDYQSPGEQDSESTPTKKQQIAKDMSEQQIIGENNTVAAQSNVDKTSKKNKEVKTKATFYLGKTEKDMLLKLYINELKKNQIADKSALVRRAIRELYEKEK